MAMVRKILIIVHQPTSDPGLVGQILRTSGYELDIRCPSNAQQLPETMDSHGGVIIFGGPMSANDSETLPFIRTELDWIPLALASGKPYLGICLGAQLLARVLGAQVRPHADGLREIGYFPITPTPEGGAYFDEPLYVYHWHREGFELPPGAIKLAAGDVFPNQAFCYGKAAYGVQFHPEMTREILDKWTTQGAAIILAHPEAQSREQQFNKHGLYAIAIEQWLKRFLSLWLGDMAITSEPVSEIYC
jgi:GMP synthase (glutamine-hydrolysing)